jgi:1,2-diacylglycerol 3-alpha-glucosyltransferase
MIGTSGLRICIASTGLGHVTRGAESWASDLGKTLAQRGERVILCKGAGAVDSIPIDAHVVLVSSAIKKAHKRVDYLIDELAQVRAQRPDLPLWLVIAGGREGDTDELVRKAERALGDRVRFAIQFPRDRMPELYRMADVFAHGSLFEMFGTVLLEATASGVPCIVHEHPVMKWVIGPGGIATDLSTEGNLADALIEVLDDRRKREQIGLVARQHCHQKFRKEIVVEQMIRYYQRVVDRKQVAA